MSATSNNKSASLYGLIQKTETREVKNRAVFDNFKEKYYKQAYKNFKKDKEYREFERNEEIKKYAEFMRNEKGESKEYHMFLQYILYKQWTELKEYANSKNYFLVAINL